ncbi:MAG: hypothetical protein KBD55_01510 [Candidatus Pacebacteria bacterium]|nr:hypothetical protein [Candidatus Paceibacterota bacterium]
MPGDKFYKEPELGHASINHTPYDLVEKYYQDFLSLSAEELQARIKALDLVEQVSILDYLKSKKRELSSQGGNESELVKLGEIDHALLVETNSH